MSKRAVKVEAPAALPEEKQYGLKELIDGMIGAFQEFQPMPISQFLEQQQKTMMNNITHIKGYASDPQYAVNFHGQRIAMMMLKAGEDFVQQMTVALVEQQSFEQEQEQANEDQGQTIEAQAQDISGKEAIRRKRSTGPKA